MATSESDRFVQENYPGDPIREEEYHTRVEAIAEKCRCGGKYTFNSPPRCPKCKSVDITQDGPLFYD